jgi:hypothetical protein
MSLLIFHIIFITVLCLLFLVDLTITNMVLVHERVTLYLDALLLPHILIMVFVLRVGMIFSLEVSILTLSQLAL